MAERARSVLMVLEATFPKLGGGGAESQVLTIGRSLVGEGVRVRVVVPMVADGPQVARESLHPALVQRALFRRQRLLELPHRQLLLGRPHLCHHLRHQRAEVMQHRITVARSQQLRHRRALVRRGWIREKFS